MPYLRTFGQEYWKNYCQIWNQHPWIYLNPKYCELKKMPKFGTKSALFGLFLARILKNYDHIWNQHFRISVVAKFCEGGKCLNLGPKMPYLGIFDGKCLIWAFLTKNALFGKFSVRIFKKLLSYLKSAPLNLSNCKILWRNKTAKIWDQKCLIWVFSG